MRIARENEQRERERDKELEREKKGRRNTKKGTKIWDSSVSRGLTLVYSMLRFLSLFYSPFPLHIARTVRGLFPRDRWDAEAVEDGGGGGVVMVVVVRRKE